MLLPRKVGPFTLMRKLDADGMTESFVAILDAPAGKQVVARLLAPVVTRDVARMAQIRARVADLRGAVHPALAGVLDLVETDDGEVFVLEDQVEGAELRRVLDHCLRTGQLLPHNVYLNLAAQLCNALEALHARPGIESGSENVLHMALSPSSVWLTANGRITLCRYGLLRSPTALATQVTGALPARSEYLAPEQTHQDQRLTPASDLFALGSVLYELLTLRPMFRADTPLQTIHRVRRAEVTTQLLEVKEILPGLDKVLFRSLSLNPRHRYQRAFVLREDLRGLMAGYSFADIEQATREFLQPLLDGLPPEGDTSFDGSSSFVPLPTAAAERTQDLLDAVPDRLGDLSESPLDAPRVERLALADEPEGFSDGFPDDTDALLGGFTDPRPVGGTGGVPGDGPEGGEDVLDPVDPGAAAPARRTPLVPIDTGQANRLLDDTGFDALPRGDTLPFGIDGPTHPSVKTDDLPTLNPDPPSSDVRAPADPPPAPAPLPSPLAPDPTIPPGAQSKTARMPNPLAGRLGPPESLHAPGKAPEEPEPEPIGPGPQPAAPPFPKRVPAAPPVSASTAAWGMALAAVIVVGLLVGAGLCLGGGGLLGLAAMGPGQPASLGDEPAPAPTPTVEVQAAAEPPSPLPVEAPPPAPEAPPHPAGPRPPRAAVAVQPAPPQETFLAVRGPTPEPAPPVHPPVPADAGHEPIVVSAARVDAWSESAFAGRLDPAARGALSAVPSDDPLFTRAQTLVFLDAKARGDAATRDRALGAVLALPENRYDPVLLVERAQIAADREDWDAALADAKAAEQQWARIPSELVWSRKAMIYEIQAVANTGLFYRSEGEDTARLQSAIRAWERYRSHVSSRDDGGRVARADASLAALRDTEDRLR